MPAPATVTYRMPLLCAMCVAARAWPGGLGSLTPMACPNAQSECLFSPAEQEAIAYALYARPDDVRTV